MNKIITTKGIMDLEIPVNTNGTEEYYIICPICTSLRQKEHQKEKKFAINLKKDPMPWRCNHCGEGGYVITEEYLKRAKFKPVISKFDFLELSDPLVQWFWNDRKISVTTLREFKITMSIESMKQIRISEGKESTKDQWVPRKCINFKYFKDNILINIKFRDANKNFKMIADATRTIYNIDSFKGKKKGIFVEGEMDVLSYFESGLNTEYGIGSVPNGATITDEERKHFEKTGRMDVMSDINLEYLDLVIEELNDIEMFYIATDDDAPGVKLREELARRLGKERCKYIKFSDYKDEKGKPLKDANEVLIEKGKNVLASTIDTAIPYPISGVSTASQYWDSMNEFYEKGKPRGISTGYPNLDPYFNWMFGWLVIEGGYPNAGKTGFALNMIAITIVLYKWKWGIYCPENYPIHNIIDILAEILVGKTLDVDGIERMNKEEYDNVVNNFINKYIYFVDDNENGYSPEDLRKIKKSMVKQYGIIGFYTDPWSSLVHNYRSQDSEDKYLEHQLSLEVRLTTKLNIINLISHHPKTPVSTEKVPSVFTFTGGKVWWIKAYSIFAIQRKNVNDRDNPYTEFHVQKNKDFKAAGELTSESDCPTFRFARKNRRFYAKQIVKNGEKEVGYDFFPFENYQENNQLLFDGF
jgi:twinkle protein